MSLGENLLRYNKKQVYDSLDAETESLNLVFSRPWQVGRVSFTLNDNFDHLDLNKYIWWKDLKVSRDAARITRFNYQEYKERAEDPVKVLEEVEDRLHSKDIKLVNQNLIGFDSMVLNAWRRALGKKQIYSWMHEPFKCYDTLAISRAIKKGEKPDTSSPENFLAWQIRMLSIKREKLKCGLGTIAKELGAIVDDNKLHDALYDVIQVREVFRKQIWQMELI